MDQGRVERGRVRQRDTPGQPSVGERRVCALLYDVWRARARVSLRLSVCVSVCVRECRL